MELLLFGPLAIIAIIAMVMAALNEKKNKDTSEVYIGMMACMVGWVAIATAIILNK